MHIPHDASCRRGSTRCRTGRSSWSARSAPGPREWPAYLVQQGRDAVNLDGGLIDWEAAGRALVSETGQPPIVV